MLSGCVFHHVFSGFEGGDFVGRYDGIGAVVDVVNLFFGMVLYHETAEAPQVYVVAVGHVGFDGGEQFLDDISNGIAANACASMDFFDNIGFGHRCYRLCSIGCLCCCLGWSGERVDGEKKPWVAACRNVSEKEPIAGVPAAMCVSFRMELVFHISAYIFLFCGFISFNDL